MCHKNRGLRQGFVRFAEEIFVDSYIGINCSNYRIHKNQVVMLLKFRPNFRWLKNLTLEFVMVIGDPM